MSLQEESRVVGLSLSPLEELRARYVNEAPLYFANGATDVDQKRGLALYGPADSLGIGDQTIRVGIVSSAEGVHTVTSWLQKFNAKPFESSGIRPFIEQTFPGFSKAFHCRLIVQNQFNEELLTKEVNAILKVKNPNIRIRKTAELYASKVGIISSRVSRPDVIICHEPTPIEEKCGAGMSRAAKTEGALTKREREEAQAIRRVHESHVPLAPLDEDTQNMIEMSVNQDFRALLKANCLQYVPPTQILTQSAIDRMMQEEAVRPNRIGQDPATTAWNIATAVYYKANHSPWRVGGLRSGTCYIGVSFYYDKTTSEGEMAASLAQIFTDSGEGMIVRGDRFKWNIKVQGTPHLSEESAKDLLTKSIRVYMRHHDGQAPNRVVIHKSSRYSEEERTGFVEACMDVPRYDLVAISDGRDAFFYRNGDNPVLRGTCIPLGHESYLIYTKGYIPYQHSYQGPRIPRPLEITEHFGDTAIDEIAEEVIALTRLNWNTADYCIHDPVTLKFSMNVGDVLARVPEGALIRENYYYYM